MSVYRYSTGKPQVCQEWVPSAPRGWVPRWVPFAPGGGVTAPVSGPDLAPNIKHDAPQSLTRPRRQKTRKFPQKLLVTCPALRAYPSPIVCKGGGRPYCGTILASRLAFSCSSRRDLERAQGFVACVFLARRAPRLAPYRLRLSPLNHVLIIAFRAPCDTFFARLARLSRCAERNDVLHCSAPRL